MNANVPASGGGRPVAAGKFLAVDGEKLLLRGVTYGTFADSRDGRAIPERERVRYDFAAMAASGINTVRLYMPPPQWVLDEAAAQGLWVMVGLPWEDHITFLDRRSTMRAIVSRVRDGVRACREHPALLAFSVGNEIPASIARWHGSAAVERFIERLYDVAKTEDPGALVTYVNYPTTEYLHLPFLDFLSFNVFLEQRASFEGYLARLQTLADDRPLVLTELGLDSRSHGLAAQADLLSWQLPSAYEAGCAGAVVFAWTDEWHRGGSEVADWDFGLVDRARSPKPALASTERGFADLWRPECRWPRVSVIVCTHNGGRTLGECLEATARLDYPDYEVIVVDDGSSDTSGEIAAAGGAIVVRNPANLGLSASRNAGAARATGEILAYLDDDAHPDPHWLRLLTTTLAKGYAAAGGPNLPPPDDSPLARCVADAPGGPVHVMLSDVDAEHVPGCNLAMRKDVLEELGGFDPRFWIAGDDVDMCWRIRAAGHRIGFNPGAMVWHRRRASVRAYLSQQFNYGKAEALLEQKWPERYNRLGHVTWSGNVYGSSLHRKRSRRAKIRYGTWGSRLFQSVYDPAPGLLLSLAAMPEWYLLAAVLAGLSLLGLVWSPLTWSLPFLGTVVLLFTGSALTRQIKRRRWSSRRERLLHRSAVVGLTVLQPLARLLGRLRNGLSPWRGPGAHAFAPPWPTRHRIWSERWTPHQRWISDVELSLLADCRAVSRGAETDRWDLQVRLGALGSARMLCAVEEHGQGRQLVRFRVWPRWSPAGLTLTASAGLGALAAVLAGSAGVALLTAGAAVVGLGISLYDCALAAGLLRRAIRSAGAPTEAAPARSLLRAPAEPVAVIAGAMLENRLIEPDLGLVEQPSTGT